MFSTYGDGKDIQVPTWALINDIQLLGIFKQGGQVEKDKDYPLIKNEIKNITVRHLFYDFNIFKYPQQ